MTSYMLGIYSIQSCKLWQLDLQCSNVHVKFLFQIVRYIRYKKKTHIVKILNISNKLWEFTLWTCIVEWPVYTCNIMKNTRNMITQTDVNSHCHKCVNDTAWTFFYILGDWTAVSAWQ